MQRKKRKPSDTKPNDTNQRDSLTELMLAVRSAALKGARNVIPHGRYDVVQDVVSWTLLEISRRRADPNAKAIADPCAYAYLVAKREAQHWMQRETKVVPLDGFSIPNADSIDTSVTQQDIVDGIIEPAIVVRQELVDALPELFERFQEKVIDQLSDEDRHFFKLYFMDRLSSERLAEALGVQQKSVAQRWRRLLVSLHRSLLNELCSWTLGRDLYGDILRDHDRVAEFLCLLRVFIQEGFESVKALIDSIGSH